MENLSSSVIKSDPEYTHFDGSIIKMLDSFKRIEDLEKEEIQIVLNEKTKIVVTFRCNSISSH